MNYQYQILQQEETYHSFFKVRRYQVQYELFQGGMGEPVLRECLYANKFVVAALPFDPVRKEFIFIEQFRIGAMVGGGNPWQWELVAGFMDKEGESPDESMQRELREEIGTQAKKLIPVMTYFSSPGGSASQTHLYFAEVDASETVEFAGLESEGENIRVHRIAYPEAKKLLIEGKLNNANTLLALQSFLLHHQV